MMAQWNYTIRFGKQLREAISSEDMDIVVKCLIACYRELLNKLSEEDRDYYEFDIEDTIESLDYLDRMGVDDEDEEEIDDRLAEFYDLCDDVGAWVAI